MGRIEITAPAPSYEGALRRDRQKTRLRRLLATKTASTAISPWVHSRSLRSPGRLARLGSMPRAVGRLRAVHYGDIARRLDAS